MATSTPSLGGAYFVWQQTDDNDNPVGQAQSLKFDVVESEEWNLDTTVTEHPVEKGPDIADNVRISLARVTLVVFASNEPIFENNYETAQLQSYPISIDAASQPAKPNDTLTAKEWDALIAERSAVTSLTAGVGGVIGGAAGGAVGALAGSVVGGLLLAPHEVDVDFSPGNGLEPTPGQTFNPQTFQFQQGGDYVAKTWAKLKYLKGDPALGSLPQLITVIGTKDAADNMVIETLTPYRDADTGTGARFTIGLKQIRTVSTVTVTAPAPTKPSAKQIVSKGTQNPKDLPPKVSASWLKQATKILYSTLGGPATGANFSGGGT